MQTQTGLSMVLIAAELCMPESFEEIKVEPVAAWKYQPTNYVDTEVGQ